jgi:uncharacterized protein
VLAINSLYAILISPHKLVNIVSPLGGTGVCKRSCHLAASFASIAVTEIAFQTCYNQNIETEDLLTVFCLRGASMQISPDKMEIYRRTARDRSRQRQKELDERQKRAWKVARQAAEILKSEFGAERVVLYGSLIHPELFHLRSDVDLAGWNVQHYFKAVARLLDLDPEIEVNLAPVEDVRPELRAVIDREGIEL